MKLIIAIVKDSDDRLVVTRLVESQIRVTRMASTGGFLKQGNVTLLIGVDDGDVDKVVDKIQDSCSEPEPGQHKATIFVVNAVHFERT